MPVVTIKSGDGDRYAEFSAGLSLRDILDSSSFRVRSGCRGTGACGLCRVKIVTSEPIEPSLAERLYLSEQQIASGIRLACQVRPERDVEVTVLNKEPVSAWRAIRNTSGDFSRIPSNRFPEGRYFGVAVDLGTTHISASFYDLSTGKWFAGRHGLNPQVSWGADVLTRLIAYDESPEAAGTLRGMLVDAIGSVLLDVAAREGIGLEQVAGLTFVGNTAMLAMISGKNAHLLLQPSYWMKPIECTPDDIHDLTALWGIRSGAVVEMVQPLAGFVGSDLLAGVISTKLVEKGPGTLLIDFGTNSEIALWDGGTLWVTSAAGGPAFEGSGMNCGIPGEPGAIFQVCESGNGATEGDRAFLTSKDVIFRSRPAGLDLEFRTIDNEKPLGFCGSGIVDLIALLVRSGKLTGIGRLSSDIPGDGIFVLDGEQKPLVLTKKDVDIFQRAKAAIYAGVKVLMESSGLADKHLSRICIGGAFGHFLDRENAMEIGLLPELPPESIELAGNIALRGCEELLMSEDPGKRLDELKSKARLVNLARCAGFEELFMEGLYLRRWSHAARGGAD